MADNTANRKDLILETFRRFDANGDGLISRQELARVFKLLCADGNHWEDDSIDILMTAADTNKDGKIQYQEFVSWVMQDAGKEPADGETAHQELDRPSEAENPISINYRVFLPERFQVDINKRYALDKLQLGEGGYGKVFIARDKEFSSRRVAVKKVTKTSSKAAPETLANEIKVMKELDHPSICKLLGTFEQDRTLYFIMELCDGGEVFERIIRQGHISESLSADVIAQVASALAYAHGRGIAHRDIKPENVVFCSEDPADTRVKLIDWGLAFTFLDSPMTSAVGSFTYAAPEVITSENRKNYTAACDLWSLGVLAYVMLSGKPPFWGSQSQHLWNARAERYPMTGKPWTTINQDAKDFVRSLLRADPTKRLEIGNVVFHRWLTEAKKRQEATTNSAEVLQNLRHFNNSSTFERMCIGAVARQLDHHHLRDIHGVFRKMDSNGDGVLSLEEVTDGFRSLFGEDSVEYAEAAELHRKLDIDGSKCIDYTEFCAAGLGQKTHSQDEVTWAAFKVFDVNNSGFIERGELAKILDTADMQDVWSHDVCQKVSRELVEIFDKDGDGKISFQDWKVIMQKCWDKETDNPVAECQGSTPGQAAGGLDAYKVLLQVSQLKTEHKEKD